MKPRPTTLSTKEDLYKPLGFDQVNDVYYHVSDDLLKNKKNKFWDFWPIDLSTKEEAQVLYGHSQPTAINSVNSQRPKVLIDDHLDLLHEQT